MFVIALPPAVTKGGKMTGEIEYVYVGTERLKKELMARRFALRRNPDAFIFGTEDGTPVKGFRRMWRELFRLAELDSGRAKGLVWRTMRHEFISRHAENTGDPILTQHLARHRRPENDADVLPHQRLEDVAGIRSNESLEGRAVENRHYVLLRSLNIDRSNHSAVLWAAEHT